MKRTYEPIDPHDQWLWGQPKQRNNMKKIYIGYNYVGDPFALVLSDNEDKANAFFLGMNQNHSRTEEIDPTDEHLGMLGIVTVLTSTEHEVRSLPSTRDKKFRTWKRGM